MMKIDISESASTNLLPQPPNVDKDEWKKFAKTVPKYEHKMKGKLTVNS